MREPSNTDKTVTLLKVLRLLCLTVLLVPASVLVLCSTLSALNENAGWLRYRLPGLLLFVYLLCGLASPAFGIATLAILFVRRRAWAEQVKVNEGRNLGGQLVVLSFLDIFAGLIWALQFPYVLFSAGGSR